MASVTDLVDRTLRAPSADLMFGVITGFVALGTVLISKGSLSLLLKDFAIIFMLSLSGWWAVKTWRRLWRVGRGRWEEVVYGLGVRRFGAFSWAGFSVFALLFVAHQVGADNLAVLPLISLYLVVFGFPLWLWAGYWWGVGMAKYFGVDT